MCGRFVGYRSLRELEAYFPIDKVACDALPTSMLPLAGNPNYLKKMSKLINFPNEKPRPACCFPGHPEFQNSISFQPR